MRTVWETKTRDDASEELRIFGEDEISSLFDLFWDAQFEDNRGPVRSEIEMFIDLVVNAHARDAD